MFILTLVF